jgi:RluA family pseudouridine synthase
MAKTPYIEVGKGRDITRFPILHEDRSVLAMDKPPGWMLVPYSWQRTPRNLQAAITNAIAAGYFWAKCRNVKFLRNVHRLDADTSGILLFAKSEGGVESYSDLFASRQMSKVYLAVVEGIPKLETWTCLAPLERDPNVIGRMIIDPKAGKPSETQFRVLNTFRNRSLIEARPITGRTHQIRVHLLDAGLPVVGDELYGSSPAAGGPGSRRDKPRKVPLRHRAEYPLGLRAVELSYHDPFLRKSVRITAPTDAFLKAFGMPATAPPEGPSSPRRPRAADHHGQ